MISKDKAKYAVSVNLFCVFTNKKDALKSLKQVEDLVSFYLPEHITCEVDLLERHHCTGDKPNLDVQ